MNYGFFIGCYMPDKNYAGKNDVKRCVSSIRNYHLDAPIFIIDSDSKIDYSEDLKPYNVVLDFAKNKNRSTGMIWHAFKKYPQFDFYFFLHDGHTINGSLLDSLNYDVSTISYFNSHDGIGRSCPGREYGFSPNGSYTNESRDWCESMLKQNTPYHLPKLFTGVTYSVFFCKRSVLEKLYANGLSKILPENKIQDQSMERVWGIALEQAGYDIKQKTYRNTGKVTKQVRQRK